MQGLGLASNQSSTPTEGMDDGMPIKRLLVVTSNFGGGTGHHVAEMLGALDPREWTVEILCLGRAEVDPRGEVALREIRLRGIFRRFPLAQTWALLKFASFLRRFRPHVVHTYFVWPVLYGRLLKRLGLIKHLVENREDEGFNVSPRDYWFLTRSAHLPDRVICVSDAVRRVVLHREGLPQERTVVIRNGVQLPEAGPSNGERTRLREEFGFTEENLVVGMVANLNRDVKGGSYFVEAVPMVLERVPAARFIVFGLGVSEDLLARAQELKVSDQIVFAGFRQDVRKYYPIMDLSVLTSLSEGLSITLLESMSFGIPIVATKVGGNPELVRHGSTGFLVPPREPPDFADAVARLLKDPLLRRAMGERARAMVEASFSLTQVAARYERTYLDLPQKGP